MVIGSMGYFTDFQMGYIGVKNPTDPITFDLNFQRDIRVWH